MLARRRADAAELGRRQRRASRRARAKLAPITEPGPVIEVTTIGAGQAGGERTGYRDRDLRRLARTNLLNLHADFGYWNPDAATEPAPPPVVDAVEVSGTDPGVPADAAGTSPEGLS